MIKIETDFSNSLFEKKTDFTNAKFKKRTYFIARFSGETYFSNSEFLDQVEFSIIVRLKPQTSF